MLTKNDIELLKKVFATKEDLQKFATKEDLKQFATKEDLNRFATKNDLLKMEARFNQKFATKDDLKKLATKKDLERFATKEDLTEISKSIANDVVSLLNPFFEKFGEIIEENRSHRIIFGDFEKRLKVFEAKYASSPHKPL